MRASSPPPEQKLSRQYYTHTHTCCTWDDAARGKQGRYLQQPSYTCKWRFAYMHIYALPFAWLHAIWFLCACACARGNGTEGARTGPYLLRNSGLLRTQGKCDYIYISRSLSLCPLELDLFEGCRELKRLRGAWERESIHGRSHGTVTRCFFLRQSYFSQLALEHRYGTRAGRIVGIWFFTGKISLWAVLMIWLPGVWECFCFIFSLSRSVGFFRLGRAVVVSRTSYKWKQVVVNCGSFLVSLELWGIFIAVLIS